MSLISSVLLVIAVALASRHQVRESLPVKNRIVFLGDSITEQGDEPGGYVSLVRDTLRKSSSGTSIEIIGAGVSGNRVPDLLDRLDRDVLALHPQVVVVYIGINDVWHHTQLFGKGTSRDDYERGLRTLLQRIRATGARVMLCTPSVIGERRHGSNPLDSMLDEYSALSRSVAAETGASLCDLRKSMVEYLELHNPEDREEGILTTDSVHLNGAGNRFVAREILAALNKSKLVESPD